MYVLASLGFPYLLRIGMGQCRLPRGLMYALASLGAPLLLRDRRETMRIAKGSDIPLGLRLFCVAGMKRCALPRDSYPLGLRLFCVAGAKQFALPRNLIYVLVSLGASPLLRGRRRLTCTAKL